MQPYPNELIAFAAQLPVPLYAVGGCVRDALLGKSGHDVDLCSALPPESMEAIARASGVPCRTVNRRLGTVLLSIGSRDYEHTTFRTESYGAGGAHRPETVAFTDSIEADAFRRDFSINALYQNVLTGERIDPTGGLADLAQGVIRTTSLDPAVILRDDGLRILRLARFAVHTGFSIDPRTLSCAKENAALLDDVAAERKRDELNRLLLSDDPLRALTLLWEIGALQRLIPELKQAEGVLQRADYHRFDVLRHLFHAAAQTPPILPLRLMGLLHDIAKPVCLAETGTFHGHDKKSAEMAGQILLRLRYPNACIRRVTRAIAAHMFDLDGRAKEPTVRMRFAALGQEGTEDLIKLREADIRGSGIETAYTAVRWRGIYERMRMDGCPWSEQALAIGGKEIMEALQLPEGKQVAEVKRALWLHCVRRPKDNEPKRLLRLLSDYGPKLCKRC